jgi:putative acyl-CoA dehydrogenase
LAARDPIEQLPTHEVRNQPPALGDYNVFEVDTPLREAVVREGADWAVPRLRLFGAEVGSERVQELGHLANRHPPELQTFDRYGRRIDEVLYHPAYHELMRLGVAHECHSIAWNAGRAGGHVAHAAMLYMLTQSEAGVCCPLTMTHAVVPALRHAPELAAEWEPRMLRPSYDPRCIPAAEKLGATFGMAMTEKQGGSDVRANTTLAQPLGASDTEYELIGHKWFCSAPMSDAFLTLAQTAQGLSCFLVPRWQPDGRRNRFFIQRLKDKLGNRSNASSEIEYHGTYARLLGESGRGVNTIIEMVHHTRLDAAVAPAGLMRAALVQALHHARHRSVFGRPLIEQPLMRNVLADLALECEAAVALALRIARSFDRAATDPHEAALGRIATAITKYWLNKRAPEFIYEAMECLGGVGYIEESPLPRLYREAPVNSIWEGSGNVICLDVLRAMGRAPQSAEALLSELGQVRGADRRLDACIDRLGAMLADPAALEPQARRFTETAALALQAALLLQHAPAPVADAFCASRLGGEGGHTYGTLPPGSDVATILERASFLGPLPIKPSHD